MCLSYSSGLYSGVHCRTWQKAWAWLYVTNIRGMNLQTNEFSYCLVLCLWTVLDKCYSSGLRTAREAAPGDLLEMLILLSLSVPHPLPIRISESGAQEKRGNRRHASHDKSSPIPGQNQESNRPKFIYSPGLKVNQEPLVCSGIWIEAVHFCGIAFMFKWHHWNFALPQSILE